MKPLIIIQILGRGETASKCFNLLNRNTKREEYELCIVDQDATEKAKKAIQEVSPDYKITREFNSGIVFGINEAAAKFRKPGQSIIKIDDDVHILSDTWLELFNKVLATPKIGSCLGRRPTFFIDAPERFPLYIKMPKYEIDGIWVEEPINGLVGCWWAIGGDVLDKLGYLNEATQNDDMDYFIRMKALGWKSVYIPDAICYQPFDEPIDHPTYGIVRKLVSQQSTLAQNYYSIYNSGQLLYLPSIFDNNGDNLFYLKEAQKMYKEYENETKRCRTKGIE